jgi:prepilin-type N-terminal cleavage/methylation domain-containing protein
MPISDGQTSFSNLDVLILHTSIKQAQGFTLLEIMFVLFVSGLMVALVGPRFGSRLELYEQHQQLREVENSLRQLPRRARQQAQSIKLPQDLYSTTPTDNLPILKIPEGWNITFSPPLLISPLGACTPSKVLISVPPPGTEKHYSIAELSCEMLSN